MDWVRRIHQINHLRESLGQPVNWGHIRYLPDCPLCTGEKINMTLEIKDSNGHTDKRKEMIKKQNKEVMREYRLKKSTKQVTKTEKKSHLTLIK